MALDQGALASALEAVVKSFPPSYDSAGKQWAQAYGDYAAAGRGPLAVAPNVSGAVAVLGGLLAGAFGSGNAAPLMTTAFVAFWFGPPVTFAGAFPGLVSAVGPGPMLAPVFAQNVASKASAHDACAAIAAVLHAFTITVVVTVASTPSPTIGPLL